MTTGWNTDMDAAPKDGTRVLLCDVRSPSGKRVYIGSWVRGYWEDDYGGYISPIAWQPLQAPYVPEGGINSDGAGTTQVLKQEGE